MIISFSRVREGLEGELTVKVLEVGQLDALAHAQHERGAADAVEHHPQVARVQGGHGLGRRGGLVPTRHAGQRVLDVGPRGDDGAEDHEAEGEERHGRHRAAEPEHLAVRDQDDGQVLEDGVHGDGQEFQRPGAGVDHADEEERDGEPCLLAVRSVLAILGQRGEGGGGDFLPRTLLSLLRVEVAVRDDARRLAYGDGEHAHDRLHAQQEEVEVEVAPGQDVFVRHRHEDRREAVREDGHDGVLRDGPAALALPGDGRGRARASRGAHAVIVALLIVGHCGGYARGRGERRDERGLFAGGESAGEGETDGSGLCSADGRRVSRKGQNGSETRTFGGKEESLDGNAQGRREYSYEKRVPSNLSQGC